MFCVLQGKIQNYSAEQFLFIISQHKYFDFPEDKMNLIPFDWRLKKKLRRLYRFYDLMVV